MYTETYQLTLADLKNNKSGKQAEVLVNDHGDHYELKTVIDKTEFTAQADDLFSAFKSFRDKLLEDGYGIKCNAARINAIQSGMMRDLDVVYLVEPGKRAELKDVHGFWDYCEMEEFVDTEEQDSFCKKWLDSPKK